MCSWLLLSGFPDRRCDPGYLAPLCRVQVRSGGFRSSEERIDWYVLATVEVDHTRAASLAPAQRRKPQISNAARSWNLVACRGILGQIVDQCLPLFFAEQPVSVAGECRGLGDGLNGSLI